MTPIIRTQLEAMLDDTPPRRRYIDLSRSLTLLRIQGEDAEAFLQGQLSNDISGLRHGQCQLHAYCNPKGRALAILRLMRSKNDFWALLPDDLAESFTKRLKMFVMRAKVTIDIESDRRCCGFVGDTNLINSNLMQSDDCIYWVDQSRSRYLLIVDNALMESVFERTTDIVVAGDYWRALDILAAIPQVYSSTVEAFIPQNINLELVDGVSFKKGCYPGQEIIARIKYLGKSKKRLIIANINSVPPLSPGDAIYAEGNPDSKVGVIVDVVGRDDQTWLLSAMVPATLVGHGTLTVDPAIGNPLQRIAMPYQIPDQQ